MSESLPLLVFLHIPKTAGSTLIDIIRRQHPPETILMEHQPTFDERMQALPRERIDQLRVMMGHLWFGVHASVPRPVTYSTFLRDPVERIVSHYYYVRREPAHPMHAASLRMSLRDYVGSGCSTELQNDQTRLIAGIAMAESGASGTELLAAAKSNLTQRFAVVGLTEEFDRSLILMKRAFGWSNPFYLRRNVSRHPAKAQLPDDTLRVVEQHNALDIELWKHGHACFQERVRRQDPSFEKEVRRFKTLNASYGRLRVFVASAARRLRRPSSS
jgi:hypothetical protein